MSDRRRALTIAFVGVDGSGKSTLIDRIADWLTTRGTSVATVKIRSGRSGLDRQAAETGHGNLAGLVGADAALLMMAAVTWQSVRDTKPLRRQAGSVLLLDRSTHCMLALAAVDAPAAAPAMLELFAPLPRPDVVVHVRVDPDVAVARLDARGGTPQDREFLRRFDAAYLGLDDAASFLTVDGNGAPDAVFAECRAALLGHLPT